MPAARPPRTASYQYTISLQAHHALRGISSKYSDPTRAYHILKQDLHRSNTVEKAKARLRFIKELIRLKVGTHEVEHTAAAIIYGTVDGNARELPRTRTPRLEQEVVRTLQVWERRMEGELKEKEVRRREAATQLQLWREEATVLPAPQGGTMAQHLQQYRREAARETSSTCSQQEELYGKRAKRLVRKVKQRGEVKARWQGVLVTDNQVEEEKERRNWDQGTNYLVLDDIQLSVDEVAYLNLPGKFREFEPATKFDMEVELEVHGCKQRWDLSTRREVEEVEEGEEKKTTEEVEEELNKRREEKNKAGEIYDEETKKLDMSKLKVNQLKKNPRVFEPKAANIEDDIKLEGQRLEVLRVCEDLLQDPTLGEEGRRPHRSNLSPEERRGKRSLQMRIKDGELLVYPTDKSGKMVVSLPSTYKEAAKVHLEKDEEVTWDELSKVEVLINRHTTALRKVLSIGEQHPGRIQQLQGALKSEDSPAPNLYLTWKDHKPYEVVPPTRPVCDATVGPLARSSEILSLIINKVMDQEEDGVECLSSEEMQRAIFDANLDIKEKEQEGTVVFSMDVDALYPNMDKEDMVQAVQELFMETVVEVEGVQVEELAKYLAVTYTKEELEARGLTNHIPRRTVEVEGRAKQAPGIAYLDTDIYVSRVRGEGQARKEKWDWDLWQPPTMEKQREMVAMLVSKQVEVVVTNHIYSFNKLLFKQRRGGPIGLALTQAISRALLRRFDKRFTRVLDRMGLVRNLHKRYVDDTNMAGKEVPHNMVVTKDSQGSMKLEERPVEEQVLEQEEQEEPDMHTANIYKEIADNIMPKSVKMKVDAPSRHPTNKVPVLDMELWMQDNSIMFQHYSKPMATKSLIMAKSAFTTREIKNILLEEGSRRLRNCHPELPWTTKTTFLNAFNIQMKEAGHTEEFRDMITTRVVAKYKNSARRHRMALEGREGGKAMYRTRREREVQWKEQGGRPTSSNWFRRAGYTSVLNVPASEGSELAGRVARVLEVVPGPSGLRPRAQEVPGRSVLRSLTRSNPFPRPSCGRLLCPWVARGEECEERCYKENVCYVFFCKLCEANNNNDANHNHQNNHNNPPKPKAYLGETSKTTVTRSRRHHTDYGQARNKLGRRRRPVEDQHDQPETSSWMVDHQRDHHQARYPEQPTMFQCHQLKSFRKPLHRQVGEAVYIRTAETRGSIPHGKGVINVDKQLMNRKDEKFNFNPRGRQWWGGADDRGRQPGL